MASGGERDTLCSAYRAAAAARRSSSRIEPTQPSSSESTLGRQRLAGRKPSSLAISVGVGAALALAVGLNNFPKLSGGEELVKAAQKYETDSCACKDVACTTKATQDYSKTTTDLTNMVGNESDGKKIAAASTKAAECVTKLAMMAGVPAMLGAK